MTRFAARRQKLKRAVKRMGADAILVTNFTNVTYLTGFTGDDSFLLVGDGIEVLLSDSRYDQQIREECPGLEISLRGTTATLVSVLEKLARQAAIGSLAVEANSMTLDLHGRIGVALTGTQLIPTSGMVETLREIKDRVEISAIRAAIQLAEKVFGVVRASVRPEQTEQEIAHQIERLIHDFGGSGPAFPPIVAAGHRAALPHAVPTDQQIGRSDLLLIDWGATRSLYRSDLTRILVTGRISPKLERIYGLVLKAQQQAIAAIRPGALMSEVDRAARSVIADAGHGKHFGHALGHGFGLEVHEQPRLAANVDRPLKPGMIVTVEPGIYLPRWGGIRIEDDILVTRDGHEVLSLLPTDLASCIVSLS